MRILLFDNHDSFTYNLLHLLEAADASVSVEVLLNDAPDFSSWRQFDKVVLSPGPGLPVESGRLMEFIVEIAEKKPLLGVCLGHQALVEHFGGRLLNLNQVLHGKTMITKILDESEPLFKNLPRSIETGHYHSWVADPAYFPENLNVTATLDSGHIMAFRHRTLDVVGVQFHPESILTPLGARILANWIKS